MYLYIKLQLQYCNFQLLYYSIFFIENIYSKEGKKEEDDQEQSG